MNEKLENIKSDYDSKMAKLLLLTESKLPEFKERVYEIDILILKMFKSIEDESNAKDI